MYVSVTQDGSKLNVVEAFDNKLYFKTVKDFEPEIFTDTSEESEWHDLVSKEPVRQIKFKSIWDYISYKNEMKRMRGIKLFNDITPEYQYIREHYKGQDTQQVNFWYLDIETGLGPSDTFPNPLKAEAEITLIQIAESISDDIYIFGWLQDYKPVDPNVKYLYCKDEFDMLSKFIEFTYIRQPAITVAWNGDGFDFPTIVNRARNIGIDPTAFSYFNKLEEHKAYIFGNQLEILKPEGFYWIDYIEAYKKADPSGKESWSLEYMSKFVLGDEEGGKIDYKSSGYIDMKAFILKDYDPDLDIEENSEQKKWFGVNEAEFNKAWFNKFVEYGAEDVRVLKKMDQKLNVLNSLIELAQTYGCNVYDVFATVKPWQIYIYNELYKDKVVLPAKTPFETYKFNGGFVFAMPGLHKWVISEDYTSLYPFCLMSLNLSPETWVPYEEVPQELFQLTQVMRDYKEKQDNEVDYCEEKYIALPQETKLRISRLLKENNMVMAPNGTFYYRDIDAILPKLTKNIFLERKHFKKLMKEAENKVEELKNEIQRRGLKV